MTLIYVCFILGHHSSREEVECSFCTSLHRNLFNPLHIYSVIPLPVRSFHELDYFRGTKGTEKISGLKGRSGQVLDREETENVKENYKHWSQVLNKFRVTTQFIVQTEILLKDKGGTVNIVPGQQAQAGTPLAN